VRDVHENCHKLINRIQLDWEAVWLREVRFVTYCLKAHCRHQHSGRSLSGAIAQQRRNRLKAKHGRSTWSASGDILRANRCIHWRNGRVIATTTTGIRPTSRSDMARKFLCYSVSLLRTVAERCRSTTPRRLVTFIQWQGSRTLGPVGNRHRRKSVPALTALRTSD